MWAIIRKHLDFVWGSVNVLCGCGCGCLCVAVVLVVCVWLCQCVCMCVFERERERKRDLTGPANWLRRVTGAYAVL